jgi:hypothetical protein
VININSPTIQHQNCLKIINFNNGHSRNINAAREGIEDENWGRGEGERTVCSDSEAVDLLERIKNK